MSEETGLTTLNLENLPAPKYESTEALAALTSPASFIPRIQLYGANSEMVQTGKITMGHYGLVRSADVVEDLGDEVNCWPLAWRFKAMRLGEQVIAIFNPDNPEFKKIVAESSVPGQQGALAGLEFLLYIPDNDAYVTFFMANASGRKEAPNVRALIGKPATFKSTLAQNKKGRWHAPVVIACQTPIDPPDLAAGKTTLEMFANPKESVVETAKPEETAASSRAR